LHGAEGELAGGTAAGAGSAVPAACVAAVSTAAVGAQVYHHMVHAGPRYKCCDQKALGMRAYRRALHEKDVSTSERRGWKYIDYIRKA
jgi:hypothetical protein